MRPLISAICDAENGVVVDE